MVAKLLYIAKRTRPDLLLSVSFLSTRVNSPDIDDWSKLNRLLKYINGTKSLGIILSPEPDGQTMLRAFIDASYGVHRDGKSHSGMLLSLGCGPILVKSSKQKIVTKSSTEAELVALSDNASIVIWSRDFLIAQGEKTSSSFIYQDNMSTMALTEKASSTSERTRHINIRYFWIKEKVDSGILKIEYLPTEKMLADVLTKPLQGARFNKLRDALLNWKY
jgi:hypothetical protein